MAIAPERQRVAKVRDRPLVVVAVAFLVPEWLNWERITIIVKELLSRNTYEQLQNHVGHA